MDKMKEEYLEIEEYDHTSQMYDHDADGFSTQYNSEPQQSQPKVSQHLGTYQQDHNEQQHYQTQPQDFDGNNDDQMLRKLLKKFQMTFLYPFLKAYDVTYRSLRYLSVDDINTTIRSVGHRAEFREKLFAWRRKRYRTNDVIIDYEKNPQTVAAPEAVHATPSSSKNTRDNNPASPSNNTKAPSESQYTFTNSTSFQNLMKSLKQDAPANDTSPLQYLINDLPPDMEIDGIEAKRAKFEAVVDLRENRLNTQLNLDELLNDSLFGPVMRAYYDKYGFLERKHRDELIHIVVNHVTANEIKLHSSDFAKIVDMIVNIFPSEEESRDYYFINRQGKRNPMGRLYTKYYNTLKRMRVRDIHQEFTQESTSTYLHSGALADDSMQTTVRMSTTSLMGATNGTNGNDANNASLDLGDNYNSTQIELIEGGFEELIQLDDTSVSAIKNFLRCQGLDWDDVKTMWSKTYLSRQEDVEHSTIKDVLQQWPKYLNARGIELLDIDFRLKFSRNKANVLHRKWSHFAQKMSSYYQTNIKDEMCKGLFALWKTKPGKDTEDYILTVLLNAIIIPMARYRDAVGNRRKISIVEAVDLFAIRVTNLEELDQKREEISIKYGDMHTDFTPLIVVVGDNNINIHEIYVHFDIALYEMPDFLSALDACMKIYRVLNLPFPASNEYIWTFIQRYFYEIVLLDDVKCPSMSSIISYLKF